MQSEIYIYFIGVMAMTWLSCFVLSKQINSSKSSFENSCFLNLVYTGLGLLVASILGDFENLVLAFIVLVINGLHITINLIIALIRYAKNRQKKSALKLKSLSIP